MLSHEGVPFEEVNIRENPEALMRMLEWGYRSTPITIVGDERIQGFDRARLLAALGRGEQE